MRVLQGNFDAGISEFTAALAADPNYERAYFGRAECLRCKGQLQDAEVSGGVLPACHLIADRMADSTASVSRQVDVRRALELDPAGADTRELLEKLTNEISQQARSGGNGPAGMPSLSRQAAAPTHLSNHGHDEAQGRYVPFDTNASARTFQIGDPQLQQQQMQQQQQQAAAAPNAAGGGGSGGGGDADAGFEAVALGQYDAETRIP